MLQRAVYGAIMPAQAQEAFRILNVYAPHGPTRFYADAPFGRLSYTVDDHNGHVAYLVERLE